MMFGENNLHKYVKLFIPNLLTHKMASLESAIVRLVDGAEATFAPFIVADAKEDESLREFEFAHHALIFASAHFPLAHRHLLQLH